MNRFLILIALLTTGMACSTNSQQQTETTESATADTPVNKLEEAVMATHDSTMALMSELMRVKKQVKTKGEGLTGAEAARASELQDSLNVADEAMMTWMNQYNGDTLRKLSEPRAIEYLTDQKKTIDQVRDRMKKSIASASEFVQ
ncbi:hypothetical protein GCM10027578_29580 [Spirosoma luteolum]